MPDESAPPQWIDTHCHLDAREFDADRAAVVARADAAGVTMQVIPAVGVFNFDTVRNLAHEHRLAYALGIHPLCVGDAPDEDLDRLEQALQAHKDDPRLVAIGEIGVDLFVPGLIAIRPRQEHFYREQLKLARRFGLPVLTHVRRSADAVLAGLRRIEVPGGIAHAFNGSDQQAGHFVDRGFRLGFGGSVTFETAQQIRRIAASVPASALVLETDSPDIPPHWLYRTAAERESRSPALPQARNEPAEVARIAESLAALRGMSLTELSALTRANALAVMPRLATL
ncbi:TatD family hydrolase [Scleromatobacter humisilvae]|uniref:TatD family hydrolase n=1 Tax=Scleromatobacter humisilvae TaxID=2897159 RepID=A0A9X2BXB7_9BURK|nr:TatD family hydrolase [Scleromatobacter humisilvae]MCK9684408.1 TatD family hydrolase [Scleromatobacter humisilvae]